MKSYKIPKHIAFIMDGNRRWAKKRGLQIISGHNKGAANIERLVSQAARQGLECITFWAFSSENWERGKEEVDLLMQVFRDFINGDIVQRMIAENVKVRAIGDLDAFPKDIVEGVKSIIEASRINTGIIATFALNYGGRQEILRAVNEVLKEKGLKKIKEADFSSCMYNSDLPDPDIIVRTGGEKRLSGFMPWQSVYSELFFMDTLWPDFDERDFDSVLEEFSRRDRRFGK
jgi:undecaprenyl diphosphate synthase